MLDSIKNFNVEERERFLQKFIYEIIESKERKIKRKETRKVKRLGRREEKLIPSIIEKEKPTEEMPLRLVRRIPIVHPVPLTPPTPLPPLTPTRLRFKLAPTKTKGKIGEKIAPLMEDKSIKVIECSDGKVKIKRNAEEEETKITLSEDEVRKIIKKFSEETKIPLLGNIFRAQLEDMQISAIVSEVIPSRFIMTRIRQEEV